MARSCEPEASDYQHVAERILLPLITNPSRPTRLLLAGYSAGSLAASRFRLPNTAASSPLPLSLSISYLLISYPLSVLPFLTLLRSSTFHASLAELARSDAPVLAVHGDGDQFTGVARYEAWARRLSEAGRGWKSIVVEGADHFWRDGAKKGELVAEVRGWLRGLEEVRLADAE